MRSRPCETYASLAAYIFCSHWLRPGKLKSTPSKTAFISVARSIESILLTNDSTRASSSGGVALAPGLAGTLELLTSPSTGEVSNSKVPAKPGASATPPDELARVESLVNKIDSMDRATLMKAVLEGVDFNFPGRSQWEQKMYAAKLAYVSQGRDLIQKAKQLSASAQSLQGNKNPDDPRVKDLTNKLKELVQNGTRADAAFQAVILEGRDLAGQSSPH